MIAVDLFVAHAVQIRLADTFFRDACFRVGAAGCTVGRNETSGWGCRSARGGASATSSYTSRMHAGQRVKMRFLGEVESLHSSLEAPSHSRRCSVYKSVIHAGERPVYENHRCMV